MPSMSPPVIPEKLLKLMIDLLKKKKIIAEDTDEEELINQIAPNMPRLTKDSLVNDPSLLDRIAQALVVAQENLKGAKLPLDMEKFLRLTSDDNLKELKDMTKLILDHVAKKNPEAAKKLRLMVPPILLDKELDKTKGNEKDDMKKDEPGATPTMEPGKPKPIIQTDDAGNFIGYTSAISTSGAAGDDSLSVSEDLSNDYEGNDEFLESIGLVDPHHKKHHAPGNDAQDDATPDEPMAGPSLLDEISDDLGSALDNSPRPSPFGK